MRYHLITPTTLGLFALIAGVVTPVQAEQLALPSSDLIAPEVTQIQDSTPVKFGESHTIRVNAKDNVGVKSVVLFYRTIGSQSYSRKLMTREQGDEYSAQLTADELALPGVEYYIQAEDLSGNTLLHGYSFSPLSLVVEKNLAPPAATAAVAGNDAFNTEDANKGITLKQADSSAEKESIFKNKWLWIGVGVVAAAIAAGGGGGDGSPSADPAGASTPTTNITFTGPAVPNR